jgi:hypothetical protein
MSELGSAAIAAAMPGSRDDVLDTLQERLARDTDAVDEGDALRDAAAEELGEPCDLARVQWGTERLELAAASAHRCGNAKLEAAILVELGRFDEAFVRDPDNLIAAIATRHFDQAATLVSDDPDWACGKAYLRFAGGHRDAFDHTPEACMDVATLALPSAQRIAELDAIAATVPRNEYRHLDRVDVMRALAGEPPRRIYAMEIVESAGTWTSAWLPAIATAAPRDLAIVDETLGDFAEATRLAQPEPYRDEIRLHIGEPAHIDERPSIVYLHGPRCEQLEGMAFERARAGSGDDLASLLETCQPSFDAYKVLAVLPSITAGRAHLAAALRHYHPGFGSDNAPYDVLAIDADYRDFARLVGDDVTAGRWQAILARYAPVMRDRDIGLAFYLLARR